MLIARATAATRSTPECVSASRWHRLRVTGIAGPLTTKTLPSKAGFALHSCLLSPGVLGVAYWAPRLAPGPRAASDNPLRHRRPAGWCCSARPSCPCLARDPSGLRRSGPTWPAAFAGRWALDSAQGRCCLTQPGWPQPTMLSVSSWSFLWVSPQGQRLPQQTVPSCRCEQRTNQRTQRVKSTIGLAPHESGGTGEWPSCVCVATSWKPCIAGRTH